MKRRRLSGEESALWRRATRDVRRLAPGEAGPPAGPVLGETTREAVFPVVSNPSPLRFPTITQGRKTAPPASVFDQGDPAAERRLRRGRLAVERRLDLHGLTQAAAHVRLMGFLEQAARDGLSCVLIITGKGARGAEDDPYRSRAPRGVIRMRFMDWIEEEPLRSLVARAAPAAPKDGGAGAFYLFLKKRRQGDG